MTQVEIEYCTECNFLPQALSTTERILKQHHDKIDALRLKTGKGGVFKIRVDDEIVWDKNIEELDMADVDKSLRPHLEESPQQSST